MKKDRKNIIRTLLISLLFMNNSSFFPWEYVNKNNQAIEEYKKNSFLKAENLFKESLNEKPEDFDIKYNIAGTLYKQKKYIESQSTYLQIIKDKSSSGELKQKSHYNLGNVLYRLGEQSNPEIFWNNALKEYERALNISPEDKLAKENYDFVNQKLKKLENQQNNNSKNEKTNNSNQENKTQPQQQVYSNTSNQNPIPQDMYEVTKAEADNILKDMKIEEENMQNYINRRELSTEQRKSNNKLDSLKKDW